MKIAKRDKTYTSHSRFNDPGLWVLPGEPFFAETELCSGSWLKSLDDTYSPEKDTGPNPTVCIGISGAKPGDMLSIDILDIAVDTLGYTGFDPGRMPLPNLLYKHEWGLTTKTVKISDGFVHWNDSIRLPVRPMIGTLGTAPGLDAISNAYGGEHGGNMDVNEITTGSTVYLPVFADGALLHIGDVHAIQGDGEINGAGGIECRAAVKIAVNVLDKPAGMKWVRLENDDYIMTIACCLSIEESFYSASGEMLNWIVERYKLDLAEAYLLMGEVMEARCTQFVNPTRTYICKMPKRYLASD